MTLRIVVHKAEEGGYWAEVPALPGCATEGKTMEELVANIREAVEGVLNVLADQADTNGGQILEVAV
jgi:predicted RNase H-like HicB family nuclease